MKKRRNTPAFTFMAYASFALAFLAMFIGIYTLDEPLPVKGYYVVSALFLVMSSFVLQKTIRDNQEDDAAMMNNGNTHSTDL
ncbi:MAG: YiaA/YiaB family inner membrane protein [Tumebacillaceae bacterium]